MSAWELKRDHLTRYCLFGIDSSEDLAMLPTSVKVGSGDLIRSTTCAIGSIARASDGSQYILTGDNEWIGYDAGGGGLVMYECQEGEYDAETGVPTIEEPNESTIYLVPTGDSEAPYRGWIYINDEWAQFAGGGGGGGGSVDDVQVNGSSIVNNGIANLPIAGNNTLGLTKGYGSRGISIDSNGNVYPTQLNTATIKYGNMAYAIITVERQHESVFYGLARAAGDSTMAESANPVGTYTDEAKTAIKSMLGISDGANGLPAGGATGQVLKKTGSADYAAGWSGMALNDLSDVSAPSSSTVNYILKRNDNNWSVSEIASNYGDLVDNGDPNEIYISRDARNYNPSFPCNAAYVRDGSYNCWDIIWSNGDTDPTSETPENIYVVNRAANTPFNNVTRRFVYNHDYSCYEEAPLALDNEVVGFWTGTQAQYDALATKDAHKVYFIQE